MRMCLVWLAALPLLVAGLGQSRHPQESPRAQLQPYVAQLQQNPDGQGVARNNRQARADDHRNLAPMEARFLFYTVTMRGPGESGAAWGGNKLAMISNKFVIATVALRTDPRQRK